MSGARARCSGCSAPEPLTAYEVALQMWGNVAVTQAFLTISEVLGHMDLLVRDGHVLEAMTAASSRFRAARCSARMSRRDVG